MKFYFKKNAPLLILLFFYYSADAFVQELLLPPVIETTCFNFTAEVAQEALTSYTIMHEDYVTVVQDYHNLETGREIHTETNFNFNNFSEFNRPTGSFDCQLPTYHDSPQSSSIEKDINHLDDHLKDFAIDQRRQSMQGKHTPLNHTIALDRIYTTDGVEAAVLSPDIASFLQRCEYSLRYQLQEKVSSFTRKKTLAELQAKPNFISSLRSGKIVQLMRQIQNSDLATAEAAYGELQQLWPWKHKHAFLNMDLYSAKERKFIKQLRGLNLMKIAERELLTRLDYIAKYADKQSLKMISTYMEKCRLLQQQGNRDELCREVERLCLRVSKNGKKENFTTNTYLAISTKFLVDPLTTKLYNIARLPTEKAYYVDIQKNQTVLSDPINCIVSNIKDKNLPEAHAELVHCEGQIAQELADRNITEPAAQQERIIQDFGSDVRATVRDAYQERADIVNLTEHFIPIDVLSAAVEILNTNMTYESVSSGFEQVAQQVLENAKLCDLECLPHVEDQIIESLHVMRTAKNDVEFVFNVTVVDHLLTDLQCQVEAIVAGKPTLWERSPELLSRALSAFISRLSPIEQAKSISFLMREGGYLLGNAIQDIAQEICDPVGTMQQNCVSALHACEYIMNVADFMCDAISGAYYLPAKERSQRLENYLQMAGQAYNSIESQITAEQVADAVGHIAADIVVWNGVIAAGTYLKEIDAIGKISSEAKTIAQGLKNAVEEHPAFVTTEGIVLKMSNGVKNAGNAVKESAIVKNVMLKVANMKEFFELPFGQTLKTHSFKTNYQYQNQSVYRLTENISGTHLKKGYYYYLDNLHKDHIEVFNKQQSFVGVYNLDGTFNVKKFQAAEKEGRNIKTLMKG